MPTLLEHTDRGLYCAAGDFHIDPTRAVDRAVITHGHADHARRGSGAYLCAREGVGILRWRLGAGARIRGVAYREAVEVNGVRVSFHPAGHILGSAQVRVEHRGEVWVVSGDYKTEADPTCATFEPVRCHAFVTESTFALPGYAWRPQEEIFREIHGWWRENREAGRASVLFGYSLGKAQRLLAGLDPSAGPILVHGAAWRPTALYREAGVELPAHRYASAREAGAGRGRALILAPPSARRTPWMQEVGPVSTAFASGWMLSPGMPAARGYDRGFALSDHADWNGILGAVRETGADTIWAMHGYDDALARHLRREGLNARALSWEGQGGPGPPAQLELSLAPPGAPTD